eukprot:2352817-Amphidinium_carterae.1
MGCPRILVMSSPHDTAPSSWENGLISPYLRRSYGAGEVVALRVQCRCSRLQLLVRLVLI